MRQISNSTRADRGLALCVCRTASGGVRLVIDDVLADSDEWPQNWRSHRFVTRRDYASASFDPEALGEDELLAIGRTVAACLSTLLDDDR